VAGEGEIEGAEHVERGHRRRGDAEGVDRRTDPLRLMPLVHVTRAETRRDGGQRLGVIHEGAVGDLVLRGEAGEKRRARDRERGHGERGERPGHVFPQAAHVAHVLRLTSSWMRACIAWMTLPAPRKRHALKNACVRTWKNPAVNAPTPTPM